MGEHKNLGGRDAVEKIRTLIEAENICMFLTKLNTMPLDSRPMATAAVDDDGTIWFFSKVESTKNSDIMQDSRVQLFYANRGSSEYLSVYGEASISNDKNKIEELWSAIDKAWFEKGKEDPSISLISVKPVDAYYWDTKNNKLISLIKIASAVLTGKTADDGLEGKLELSQQK